MTGYRFTVGHGETDSLEWTLESVHFPDPVTRWSAALYTTTQTAVIEQLMAELGILLDGVAFRELDGRIYTALVPFGGAARKPQPRWLLPIISRTSPTLRQRLAAAHAADVNDWSGAVVEEWHERAEDDLLERGRAYLVGDLSALERGAGRGPARRAAPPRRGGADVALPAPRGRRRRHRPARAGADPGPRLARWRS